MSVPKSVKREMVDTAPDPVLTSAGRGGTGGPRRPGRCQWCRWTPNWERDWGRGTSRARRGEWDGGPRCGVSVDARRVVYKEKTGTERWPSGLRSRVTTLSIARSASGPKNVSPHCVQTSAGTFRKMNNLPFQRCTCSIRLSSTGALQNGHSFILLTLSCANHTIRPTQAGKS